MPPKSKKKRKKKYALKKSFYRALLPSTLLLVAIVVIFLIMAIAVVKNPNVNNEFILAGKDLLKILGGAVAGAFGGESYVRYIKNE